MVEAGILLSSVGVPPDTVDMLLWSFLVWVAVTEDWLASTGPIIVVLHSIIVELNP